MLGISLALIFSMSYRARYEIIWDGATFHVTWQCHNHSWLMQYDWAKQLYYDLLLKYKNKYGVSFYSHHFMDNHVHLSGKINKTKEEFSALFQVVNTILAKKINKRLKRRGQVIMDRFKSPCIQSDKDQLAVMTYHDLNSWRAQKVKHPKEYQWSSYGYYAYGKKDPLITPAPAYLGLANTNEARQKIYRKLIASIMEEEGIKRKNYSRVYYIGDPNWVLERKKRLKEIKQIKREAFLLRQKRQIYAQAPP